MTASQIHELASTQDLTAARLLMVDGQIRPNRVETPALLDRLEAIPREYFVQPGEEGMAYREGEVAVTPNRFLLAPMLLGKMIEALEIAPGNRVLDVAPASGYSTAILAALTDTVVTALEADAQLSARATQLLNRLDIAAHIMHGPLSLGAKEHAPYDAIFVNGAVTEVPAAWLAQLNEAGRLVAVVGGQKDLQPGAVRLFRKFNGQISSRVLFEAAASYLPGFAPGETFTF